MSYRLQAKMSETKKPKRSSPSPRRQSNSAPRIQAGQKPALQYSRTPTLRAAEPEHEDEQEASSRSKPASDSIRDRVLNAAFSLFREHGFSSTSMLDIVTEARISKRDLYALFRNKHEVLSACISERTERMRRPLDTMISAPQTRDALTTLLVEFGVSALKTMCHPDALTVFRLAIAESDRAPEVARTLDSSAREANVRALTELIRKAQSHGLIAAGDPAVLVARFFSALAGDLLIRLLMRVREAPTEREIVTRARAAAETVMADR
jgi:AcrR family transcriptional regulator